MNFIITLILLLFILGFIVFFHEFGHFLAAKKAGVYISEFCIGMGPKLFGFKRKNDETEYTIRLLPIGGFVAMASEENPELKIKKDRVLENKKFYQKVLVLIMGIVFNYILAVVLFFTNGLIFGSPETKPYIGAVQENSAADLGGLKKGDLVLSINDVKVNSWDDALLELTIKEGKTNYKIVVERDNSKFSTTIEPKVIKDEEGNESKAFGFAVSNIKKTGFVNAIKYSFEVTGKLTRSVFVVLGNLFTGQIGVNNLSGPVGIYSLVDKVKSEGFETIIYLIAYLSINVGVLNLLPIPVFDGGRLLLVIIEKIKGKKLNPNIETYLNYFGFILLVILMIFVTFNDIIKLL